MIGFDTLDCYGSLNSLVEFSCIILIWTLLNGLKAEKQSMVDIELLGDEKHGVDNVKEFN